MDDILMTLERLNWVLCSIMRNIESGADQTAMTGLSMALDMTEELKEKLMHK